MRTITKKELTNQINTILTQELSIEESSKQLYKLISKVVKQECRLRDSIIDGFKSIRGL